MSDSRSEGEEIFDPADGPPASGNSPGEPIPQSPDAEGAPEVTAAQVSDNPGGFGGGDPVPADGDSSERGVTQRDQILLQLQQARTELLDLSSRNRLLSTPRHKRRTKTIEIIDEKADQVFKKLVSEGAPMSFLPRVSDAPEVNGLSEVEELDDLSVFSAMGGPSEPGSTDWDEEGEAPHRHTDSRLQTSIDDDRLRKRLLQLHNDGRTALEEQGFNILYLALGFLEWYEDSKTDKARFAPLLLIPATLDRTSARARFKLSYSEEELSTNLSLLEKLRNQFSIDLPEIPETEDLVPSTYLAKVADVVREQPRWRVLEDDMVLGIFSFSKFLMYKDLDPDTWPLHNKIENQVLLKGLLSDGFSEEPAYSDDTLVDEITDPVTLPHVLDADSSQTLAIEEVRADRNLVIQGPPGTGKSQTIANLIAAAVHDEKTVLFVAEKRAALEVVKRRMDNIGLGDMCLELHSHKARKRVVLEDLGRTLRLGRPRLAGASSSSDLRNFRNSLNEHAQLLHQPLEPSQVTPFTALGTLSKLNGDGIDPPDFQLPEASEWVPEDVRAREPLVEQQASLLRDMGQPNQHPWRGVGLNTLLPPDAKRLGEKIDGIRARLLPLSRSAEELGRSLHLEGPSFEAIKGLIALARAGSEAPGLDWQAMAGDVWEEQRGEIDTLLQKGEDYRQQRGKVGAVLSDVAWHEDLSHLRRTFARHGNSIFRWFSGGFREAQRELRSYAVGEIPKRSAARVALLDALSRGKEDQKQIEALDPIGSKSFGTRWKGPDSDWPDLSAIGEWAQTTREAELHPDFRRILAEVEDLKAAGTHAAKLGTELRHFLEDLSVLFDEMKLDLVVAFSCEAVEELGPGELSPEELIRRLRAWSVDQGGLQEWILFTGQDQRLRDHGLSELADRLIDGRLLPENVMAIFRYAFFESVIRKAWENVPALREFDGRHHGRILEDFRRLDIRRIEVARAEVAHVHYEGIPKDGGTAGEIGTIRQEVEKRRRHKPLRRLMAEAGTAIQKIKPVFMMSPMSVAQFLRPGDIEFDLLLIDEASQVQPIEALGAVARCRQMVVVGDKRQLPPTRFFDTLLFEDSELSDFTAGDMESILALCEAMGVHSKMLRWHYRSRHESLIAVSNRSFYNDNLFIVPSPLRSGELGIKFRFLQDGVYDRGGTAVNRREAQKVADAVIGFAERFPRKTLGVGTFSARQRDAVLDELELRRRGRPDLESFFAEAAMEPFFVKNLEAIQGDERDVVFVSIGYGKDPSGYMAMNFGPLSNEGGERRLNVLISRARERMEVFSSITADDIDLGRVQMVGPRILKRFLKYAATGELDVPQVGVRDPDSDFEDDVARAVVTLGYDVVQQVGTAGFFIDLAVIDPKKPGRFLLGIECDGATYHSTRSARDRDRIRQDVLEDRGWAIHRVWSIDWFKDPEGELRKIQQVLFDAAATPEPGFSTPIIDPPEPVGEGSEGGEEEGRGSNGFVREDEEEEENGIGGVPYVEAEFQVDSSLEPHEVPINPNLRDIVTQIVEIEGPIHSEEVGRRLANVFGRQQAGRRIQEAAQRALKAAQRAQMVVDQGPFMSVPGGEVRIRDRSGVGAYGLKRAEMLPPGEIRLAISRFVVAHVGCTPDEAVVGSTRLFGFQRAGQDLKAVFEQELRLMLRDDELALRNERVYVKETSEESPEEESRGESLQGQHKAEEVEETAFVIGRAGEDMPFYQKEELRARGRWLQRLAEGQEVPENEEERLFRRLIAGTPSSAQEALDYLITIEDQVPEWGKVWAAYKYRVIADRAGML